MSELHRGSLMAEKAVERLCDMINERGREIERLRARVKVLERALHGIAEFCDKGEKRTLVAIANTARAALKEDKP